jgi:hypothetical protein
MIVYYIFYILRFFKIVISNFSISYLSLLSIIYSPLKCQFVNYIFVNLRAYYNECINEKLKEV